MVAAIITTCHGIALIGVFIWKLRSSGFADAALSVGFIIIIFSVGWTLAGFVAALAFEPKGLAEWMNRDTIALVLVTLGEIVFYTVLLRVLGKKADKQSEA